MASICTFKDLKDKFWRTVEEYNLLCKLAEVEGQDVPLYAGPDRLERMKKQLFSIYDEAHELVIPSDRTMMMTIIAVVLSRVCTEYCNACLCEVSVSDYLKKKSETAVQEWDEMYADIRNELFPVSDATSVA